MAKTSTKATQDKSVRKIAGFPDTAKITVLVKENPKRPGTYRAKRFAKYKTGMTIRDYINAEGLPGDIRVDTEAGYIRIAA